LISDIPGWLVYNGVIDEINTLFNDKQTGYWSTWPFLEAQVYLTTDAPNAFNFWGFFDFSYGSKFGNTTAEWAISPSIILEEKSVLSFDIGVRTIHDFGTMTNDFRFAVVFSPDNGVTWNEAGIIKEWTIDDFNQYYNVSTPIIIELPTEHTGLIKFAFYNQIEANGIADYTVFFKDIKIESMTAEKDNPIIPIKTELFANYPNPFNPETTIKFAVKNDELVSIDVYNIKGQKVKTLIDDVVKKGEYSIVWNGTDDNGKNVSSGIYFYKMKTKDYSAVNKMILLK
jgi:hypothetical protein